LPLDDDLRALFSPLALKPDSQIAVPDMRAVEECVRAAVREMRTAGLLPEHIIIRLRRMAANSGVDFNALLMERLVRWTVNEYFDTRH